MDAVGSHAPLGRVEVPVGDRDIVADRHQRGLLAQRGPQGFVQ